jgi:ATP/ADP translocase
MKQVSRLYFYLLWIVVWGLPFAIIFCIIYNNSGQLTGFSHVLLIFLASLFGGLLIGVILYPVYLLSLKKIK